MLRLPARFAAVILCFAPLFRKRGLGTLPSGLMLSWFL